MCLCSPVIAPRMSSLAAILDRLVHYCIENERGTKKEKFG